MDGIIASHIKKATLPLFPESMSMIACSGIYLVSLQTEG